MANSDLILPIDGLRSYIEVPGKRVIGKLPAPSPSLENLPNGTSRYSLT